MRIHRFVIAIAAPSLLAICVAFVGFGLGSNASAQRRTFTDAAAYCQAAVTVDAPDRRYNGAETPRWIKRALHAEGQYDGVVWRCERGTVLACVSGGTTGPCAKRRLGRVPSSLIRDYCRSNPGASDISPAYIGGYEIYDWACRGPVPYIVRQVMFPNARGFVPGEWHRLTPPRQR